MIHFLYIVLIAALHMGMGLQIIPNSLIFFSIYSEKISYSCSSLFIQFLFLCKWFGKISNWSRIDHPLFDDFHYECYGTYMAFFREWSLHFGPHPGPRWSLFESITLYIVISYIYCFYWLADHNFIIATGSSHVNHCWSVIWWTKCDVAFCICSFHDSQI